MVFVLSVIIWIAVSLFSGPDVMEMIPCHPFRSEDAKELYLSHYDKRSEEWPVPSFSRMIETSFGQTFIRISGPDSAPPMVLLPGGGCNSLIWLPIIKPLSDKYRTYAVDNIYDFGRSIYRKSMTRPEDLLIWLDEMFHNLKLENNINLVGLSYGGWLASQYSLHAPSRLNRVVLLAPAATIFPFSTEFIKHMVIGIIPHRYFLKRATYWALADAVYKDSLSKSFVDNHIEDAYLGLRCFKFKQPPSPTVLSDDEIRCIKVPLLFLVGENEKQYDAKKAVQRINTVAPQIEAEIIIGCGHDLWITRKKIVSEKILEFLIKENEN
jgi:pimeloyl-ACP methyl ester carboxylesterase